MLSKDKYQILWDYHGFKPSAIGPLISADYKARFLKLYSLYCEWANGSNGFKKLNEEWQTIHQKFSNTEFDDALGHAYGAWMTWKINEHLLEMNKSMLYDGLLEPFIFMDGPVPCFGCRIKGHKGWSMNFFLKKA